MKQGVIKQLDFEDLLQLPNDMDPFSCLNMLLRCWQTQQRNNCSDPSFVKAIFSAYGWAYLRLGVLKVTLSHSFVFPHIFKICRRKTKWKWKSRALYSIHFYSTLMYCSSKAFLPLYAFIVSWIVALNFRKACCCFTFFHCLPTYVCLQCVSFFWWFSFAFWLSIWSSMWPSQNFDDSVRFRV